MFSIVNKGVVKALVWFSAGPAAVFSFAPPAGRPPMDASALNDRKRVMPSLEIYAGSFSDATRETAESSCTSTSVSACESSHTQEFAST